jgi:hypothetical protein
MFYDLYVGQVLLIQSFSPELDTILLSWTEPNFRGPYRSICSGHLPNLTFFNYRQLSQCCYSWGFRGLDKACARFFITSRASIPPSLSYPSFITFYLPDRGPAFRGKDQPGVRTGVRVNLNCFQLFLPGAGGNPNGNEYLWPA